MNPYKREKYPRTSLFSQWALTLWPFFLVIVPKGEKYHQSFHSVNLFIGEKYYQILSRSLYKRGSNNTKGRYLYQTLHIKGERDKYRFNWLYWFELIFPTYSQYLHAMIQGERKLYILIFKGEKVLVPWRHILSSNPILTMSSISWYFRIYFASLQ